MKTIPAIILFALALSGCTIRTYREGSTSYTSISLGTNQQVAPFKIEAGKEGDASYRKLESKGVTSDQTTVVEAAVSAGVAAGLKALKNP